ncbi:TPA: hypothetical protein NKB00_000659 [Vibrio parahaemolyticus]|nr:hypothetical protein [Vibrio parahaemolyticus]
MEDLNKKYEILYSQLEPVKQEKLRNIVDQWLPKYRQDLNSVIDTHPEIQLVQSPVLVIGGAGIAVSKMRFQTYLKNLKTDTIILLDVPLYSYKQKEEKERVPFILKCLERALTPRKKKKEPKSLCERFTKMIKDFDAGYDVDKHMPTLTEVNRLIPHMKNVIKSKGHPTVYDWFYNTKVSHSELCILIQETYNQLTQK